MYPLETSGSHYFRPGDSIMVGLTAAVQWDERNQTSGSAAATRTDRNTKIRFDDPAAFGLFNTEAQNSNSTVTSANLQHDYRINRDYGLFIRGSYLHRDHNKYDPVSEFYSTAKTKITGEIGISSTLYGVNVRTSIGMLNLKTGEAPDQPAQTSTGLIGSVFATSRF